MTESDLKCGSDGKERRQRGKANRTKREKGCFQEETASPCSSMSFLSVRELFDSRASSFKQVCPGLRILSCIQGGLNPDICYKD